MLTRKSFLKLMAASGVSAYVATRGGMVHIGKAAQSPQIPLVASKLPQFVSPLLDFDIIASTQIELHMTEFQAKVLPDAFYAGLSAPFNAGAFVWGYLQPGQVSRPNYLGPVIISARGTPTEITYVNDLGTTSETNVDAYKYSTDQTLHWADPLGGEMNMWNHAARPPEVGSVGASNYDGPIPACPHLHGGYVPPLLDGGPDSWFTSDGQHVGHGFYSKGWNPGDPAQNFCTYRYPNDQEGSLIWFHDHTLGATRLNVYCGLAGGYLITDPAIDLSKFPPLVPLVIQDRMFDTNGQLFFPADSAGGVLWALNPEHPYWVPEFIGDVICVNGRSWPFLNVEAKRYTFPIINGSNARTYELSLTDPVSKNAGPALWVVGTDGGFLDNPVKIDPLAVSNNKLVTMPGERYWVIIDFKGFQKNQIGPNGMPYSGKWILKNTARAPYPGGASPQGSTTGRVMQFIVTGLPNDPDTSYDPSSGASLRSGNPIIRLSGATVTRQLTLNEIAKPPILATDPVTGNQVAYPGGPVEILVNNTKWEGKQIIGEETVDGMLMYKFEPRSDFALDKLGKNYLSEIPDEGSTEAWEIVNMTMDAHPIHTHLAQFQLVSRQKYDTKKYDKAYAAAFTAGGWDYTLHAQVNPGVFIPAFGPPMNYATGNSRAFGGNPDVTPYLQGPSMPALPQEFGWKDTVMCPPGMVTRFIIRWALQDVPNGTIEAFSFDPRDGGGGYVWHCHIVDHEDNEMMRPDEIKPISDATRTYTRPVDY